MSFSFAIEQLSKHIGKFIAYSMTTVNPYYVICHISQILLILFIIQGYNTCININTCIERIKFQCLMNTVLFLYIIN